jgi:hypothetical protein
MNYRNYNNEDKFKDHLIEQYKLCVQMADNVSNRREKTNKFYLTVLSGLLAILSIVQTLADGIKDFMLFLFSVLAIVLCFIWKSNISEYKKLNSAKFKVINELEKELPYECFNKEYEHLKNNNYSTLTKIEKYIPIIFTVPYGFLLLYSLYQIFSDHKLLTFLKKVFLRYIHNL